MSRQNATDIFVAWNVAFIIIIIIYLLSLFNLTVESGINLSFGNNINSQLNATIIILPII